MTFNLFPDQDDLIERISARMRIGCRSVLMQAETGSGKSIMSAAMLARARAKKRASWFLVPRRDLLKQMAKTFRGFDIPHSYIASGESFNPHAQTHICSTDTIKGRLDKLTPPSLAFIDECHFGSAGLDRVIKWLKENGTWIIGLSATPWKMSGQGLGCWFDAMECGPSLRWLIDNKRLSDYRSFLSPRLDLSRISTTAGDYAKGELSSFMEANNVLIGNAVSHYAQHAMGRRHIAYCTSIKHSEITAQAFNDAGIAAAHIDGYTPDDEKLRIIEAYARREIKVLTNCEILTFGFDLASWLRPHIIAEVKDGATIESMSDLRPTKSLALQRQKNGRVLRMKPEPALIFDHASNISEHGMPCWEYPWTLEDRETSTRKSGERAAPVKQCDICFYVHAPHLDRCPSCGKIYEVKSREMEVIDAQLIEAKIEQEKKEKRMEVGAAKTLQDLRNIAKERNYHAKWVSRMATIKNIKS